MYTQVLVTHFSTIDHFQPLKLFNMKIICNDTLKQQFFFCFINALSNEENRGVFVHLQHKPM